MIATASTTPTVEVIEVHDNMSLPAILKRVESGTTDADDAQRLRKWLLPSDQALAVRCYLFLSSRPDLANTLTEDLTCETTKHLPDSSPSPAA